MFDRSSPFVPHPAPRPQLPEAGSKVGFATDRLRVAILTCELRPGEQISEQEVERHFALTRAATRGALAHLSGEALVEALPRKGWRIAPVTPRLIRDLAVARRYLEPALMNSRPSDRTIGKLEQIADINDALLNQRDKSAVGTARRYDRQFLDTLAASGNLWVARWLAQAWNSSERAVCFLESESSARLAPTERRGLVDAMRHNEMALAVDRLLEPVGRFQDFAAEAMMSLRIDLAAPRDETKKTRRNNRTARTKDQPSTGKAPSTLDKGELEQ